MADSPLGQPTALGCMRLSTATDRDEERGLATLRAALDAGVTLLDTADAYAHDHRDVGHNERLVARVLRDGVRVATKGGLLRPKGQWVPDGRAKHLEAAAEASAERLGRPPDLYLLHAPDPGVPFETSVRALDRVVRRGLARAVGLCNVTAEQVARARAITEIAAVQAELSPFVDDPLRNGLVEACDTLLAYRPLGGPEGARKLSRDAVLAGIAADLGATPHATALAWLRSLSPRIVPLPGATRPETAADLLPALDDEAIARLDARWPAMARLARTTRAQRRPRDDAPGEVVVVMGIQGSGKTTRAIEYAAQGYLRLNRDTEGGRLGDLLPKLDQALAEGVRRVVLDNTYPRRADRNRVIEVAWAHGVPVRCEHVAISLADAQVNAVRRMIATHGDLPSVEAIRGLRGQQPGTFGPGVQLTWERERELPVAEEGFVRVDAIPFARRPEAGERPAVLIELATIRRSRRGGPVPLDPDDVEILPGAREALRGHADAGFALGGVAWHPDTDGAAMTAATLALLDVPVDAAWCPHPAGAPICWCRKPLPGLGVRFLDRTRADLPRSLFVGSSPADRQFAAALSLRFVPVGEWIAGSAR